MLHKLYNQTEPDIEWISLNFQHQFSMRRGHIIVAKTNKIRVGENILVNRLNVLNNKISLDWLNLPYGAYKRKIKEMFYKITLCLIMFTLNKHLMVTHSPKDANCAWGSDLPST